MKRRVLLLALLAILLSGCGPGGGDVARPPDSASTRPNQTFTATLPTVAAPPTTTPTTVPPLTMTPTASAPLQTMTAAPTVPPLTMTPTAMPSPTAASTPTALPTIAATAIPTRAATVTPTVMAPPTPAPVTAFVSKEFPASLEQVDTARLDTLLPAVYTTPHLSIHYLPGSAAERTVGVFADDAEAAIVHIQTSLGVRLSAREDIYLAYTFFPPPDSGVKGYTLSGDHAILLMYDGSGTREERQYMVAHELTHQIAHDGIGTAASIMLSEGLAMDMEQRYMLRNGDVSLDGFARAVLDDGSFIPITALSNGSAGFLGQLFYRRPYDEAGSFIHYLIITYGVAMFERVYTTGDYVDTYGATLFDLQSAWEQYLRSVRALSPFAPSSGQYLRDITAVQAGYADLFNALISGRQVTTDTYRALDDARVAADRADHATVAARLPWFEQALQRASL